MEGGGSRKTRPPYLIRAETSCERLYIRMRILECVRV